MRRTVCTEPQCLYKGELYVFLYGKVSVTSGNVYVLCKIVLFSTIFQWETKRMNHLTIKKYSFADGLPLTCNMAEQIELTDKWLRIFSVFVNLAVKFDICLTVHHWYKWYEHRLDARGPRWHSGWGAALQIGRSLVRFQMLSLTYSFRSHSGPGVDSASNRNEYQENFLGLNAAGAYVWRPYHLPVPLSWNLGTLTSWNPLGHSRPVTGLIYLTN